MSGRISFTEALDISTKGKLNGLLGMCEMEHAVDWMLQKAALDECEISQIALNDGDIFAYSRDLRVGLICLLAHGWLDPSYPNGTFTPSRGLIERLRKIPELSGLSDPPVVPKHLDDALNAKHVASQAAAE